ncbi:MAG TPA: ATP-binding protein, partial [Candidatus Dormibacteraeota bacterium]|nr:ATP-binding protein [Candidatus Dormibacteraeota bacterium]
MFLNSIRWRLQLWYALILVCVLAGFGFTAYELQRGRLFRRIDGELQRRVAELESALRGPAGRRPGFPESPPRGPGRDRPPPEDLPFPGDLPRPGRRDDGPDPLLRPPREFHLAPEQARLFDASDTNGFYFVLWARDGKELARSTNAPPIVPIPAANPSSPQPPRMRGELREMFHATPPGEILLAGCSIAGELMDLRRTAAWLSAIGGGILLLGLVGGWWSATRAIRPIHDISDTAATIAAGDLSKRIPISDAESELGELAGVLNSTFSRLEAAFTQQQQFTSDAAHELRTPVSVLLTRTQSTLSRERTPAEYKETLEACQRAAQRMRRLIESLLELARLDAGQEQMKRLTFDLSKTAADCVDLVRPLAEHKRIRVECNLTPLECVGDPERLGQVITNLLTNAVNYNKPDGEVRLTAQDENGSAVLKITDTGCGIAPEDLPRLFERFYRADKSRSDGRSGLG